MDSCIICCETYAEPEAVFACPHCEKTTCKTCFETYLLGRKEEPHCMFETCRRLISREYVMKTYGRPWSLHTFLPFVGLLAMEQEKTLLPQTQQEAALHLKIEQIQCEVNQLPSLAQFKKKHKKDTENPAVIAEYEAISEKKTIARQAIRELKKRSILLAPTTNGRPSTSVYEPMVQYIQRCAKEDCRGFVNGATFQCDVCETAICKSCSVILSSTHESKKTTHKCREEDRETTRLLRSECKACPKCKTFIYKSGGCSQMWCVLCHTTFDWNTGAIVKGVIHNPHYYEWLTQQNRARAENGELALHELEQLACGEVPTAHLLITHFYNYSREFISICTYVSLRTRVMECHRILMHVMDDSLPRYCRVRANENMDLRVEFILGHIDETTWQTKLMNREKKRMKNQAVVDILEMLTTVLSDIFRRFLVATTAKEMKRVVDEIPGLIEHTRESLNNVMDIHGGKLTDLSILL